METKKTEGKRKPKDLIDDTGEFVEELRVILEKIFKEFDKDQDGALNTEELASFATRCNGSPFDESTLTEMRENFDGKNERSFN